MYTTIVNSVIRNFCYQLQNVKSRHAYIYYNLIKKRYFHLTNGIYNNVNI